MTVTPFNPPDPFTTEALPTPGHHPVTIDHFDRLDRWLSLLMRSADAAKVLSRTAFVPEAMRGKPEEVAAAMMRSLELGIDPLDGLSNLHVIKGKVGYSAEFMRRRIIEAGHDIEFDEQTDERCKIRGRRAGSDKWQTVTFTAAQAKTAKIDLGLYAADKLVARASSRLCRRVFPDVLAGATIIEDVIDGDEAAPDPMLAAAPEGIDGAGRPLQRKKQPRKQPPASTPPVADEVQPAPPSDLDQFPGSPLDNDKAELLENTGHGEEPTAEQMAADPPDPEDTQHVVLISTAQLKKLSVLLREAGMDDREARHDFVSAAIGRPIDSAKDLTITEASTVIDILENDTTRDSG